MAKLARAIINQCKVHKGNGHAYKEISKVSSIRTVTTTKLPSKELFLPRLIQTP